METILNSFLLKSIIYSLLFYIVYKFVFALCGVFRKPKTKAKKNSKKGYRKPQKNQEFVSKKVLTKDEIIMLDALEQVIPSRNILVQVSMSAFMTTQNISTRNQFSRLYVDYLIVDEDYNPILSIELDGHYHKYTQDKDKRRDELLKSAGIPVIRFKEIPDIKVIRKTISRYI